MDRPLSERRNGVISQSDSREEDEPQDDQVEPIGQRRIGKKEERAILVSATICAFCTRAAATGRAGDWFIRAGLAPLLQLPDPLLEALHCERQRLVAELVGVAETR